MGYARFVLNGFIEWVIITALYPKYGICFEQIASISDTDVDLVFAFEMDEYGDIVCEKSNRIGYCKVRPWFSHCTVSDSTVFEQFRLSVNVSSMVVLTLRIILFNESMAGNYSCYDRNTYKRQIIVMSTPVNLTSVIMNANIHTFPKYNDTSIYTCNTSTTKPRAAIHWFEDGRNLTDMSNSTYDSYVSTSVLRYLPNVKGEANVSCVAIYKYREHNIYITKSTKVFVQFPVSTPTVSVNDVNVSGTITVLEGDTMRFHCFSDGFPTPAYNWNFQGHLTEGHILEWKIKRTVSDSALRCSVSNVLLTLNGSKTATSYTHWTEIILQVLSLPNAPEQAHVIADSMTENSVKLEWVPSENGDVPETFTLLWKEQNMPYWNAITLPSATTTFNLQGLAPGKKYEVKLTAENIVGKSNETDILTFETEASAHVASIVGGGIGGAFGLIIFCTLTFVIYRKYRLKRDKQPLPENSYEDLTKIRSPTMDLESYSTPGTAGPVAECYEETGFHGRSNPTYLKDVAQEQAENYEYVANTKSRQKDETPMPFDSRIYSNLPEQ